MVLALLFVTTVAATASAEELSGEHLTVTVNSSGAYQIAYSKTGWTLAGKLPGAASGIAKVDGSDRVGTYRQLAFNWQDAGRALNGFIRLYDRGDLALFSDTLNQASATPASPFPNFTKVPSGLFRFSFRDQGFAPPDFYFGGSTAPWLLFDAQAHALLVSPASHFLIAKLTGFASNDVASDFVPELAGLPAGFTRQTFLAFGEGINVTFDLWGHALTDFQGKKRPANDADTLLKYYGYWTDNGAAYYYNYDLSRGYSQTLENLANTYRQEKIPLHYLQLDSWWYHKSNVLPDGTLGESQNPLLPAGSWNLYGGLLHYTASSFLFPNGLAAFQKSIGVPLVTHNRWIDPTSPYRDEFEISGVAAIDPAFWDKIGAFLKARGATTYEQDWLDYILAQSPELHSTPDKGDAFFDEMARACAANGLTIQYCLAPSSVFLQTSKYDNVTTIRVAPDLFVPDRYRHFFYTSLLASALGVWPWSDTFLSTETTNLLLSNLSAGPVGTGDFLGQENRASLLRAIRTDGVIVKPDVPLVATDSDFVAEAKGQALPLVATTYTAHPDRKTVYAAVINPPNVTDARYILSRADLGLSGAIYVYDYFEKTGRKLAANQLYSGQVPDGGVAYLVAAPVGASGVTVLGDRNKFVCAGKQRILSLDDASDHVAVEVLLAPDENHVVLHGYSSQAPAVTVGSGFVKKSKFDAATGHFSVKIGVNASAPFDAGTDPVRHLTVTFRPGKG